MLSSWSLTHSFYVCHNNILALFYMSSKTLMYIKWYKHLNSIFIFKDGYGFYFPLTSYFYSFFVVAINSGKVQDVQLLKYHYNSLLLNTRYRNRDEDYVKLHLTINLLEWTFCAYRIRFWHKIPNEKQRTTTSLNLTPDKSVYDSVWDTVGDGVHDLEENAHHSASSYGLYCPLFVSDCHCSDGSRQGRKAWGQSRTRNIFQQKYLLVRASSM